MKRLLIPALAAAALLAGAAPALASPASINAHEARLAAEIDRGAHTGRLTRNETHKLRTELAQAQNLEHYYKRTGGVFTAWEQRSIESRLASLDKRVFNQSRDWQRR